MLAIIIPTYNGAEIVRRPLESIRQAVLSTDIEVCVYIFDDCSADETIHVVKSVFQEYSIKITIVRSHENVGETKNVNRAFRRLALDGVEWAMLMHQDDFLQPLWLPLSHNVLTVIPENVGMLSCECSSSLQNSSLNAEETALMDEAVNYEEFPGTVESVAGLASGWFWVPSGSVIRVAAHNQIGGWHPGLKYCADNDFLVRLFLSGYSVRHFKLKGIFKQLHSESTTSRTNRSGVFAYSWVYLMHRYLWFVGRRQRFRELIKLICRTGRIGVRLAFHGDWYGFWGQVVAITVMFRGLFGLIPGCEFALPGRVGQLLNHQFLPISLD